MATNVSLSFLKADIKNSTSQVLIATDDVARMREIAGPEVGCSVVFKDGNGIEIRETMAAIESALLKLGHRVATVKG